jgi:hypothetical protein
MSKVINWLSAIAGSVVTAWLVWYFIPSNHPPAPVMFEGMVIDAAKNAPLAKAMVVFEIKGSRAKGPFHDSTDDNGAYRLELPGLEKDARVTVRVQAAGFNESPPFAINELSVNNRQDFILTPASSSSPASSATDLHTSKLPYIRKLQAMRVTLP